MDFKYNQSKNVGTKNEIVSPIYESQRQSQQFTGGYYFGDGGLGVDFGNDD